MENSCQKRIAVVTGANKGIGLEICRQLLEKGVQVVLTARDELRGKAAVKKLQDQGATDVLFHRLDVADPATISSLKEFIQDQFGRLDILINNAAVGGFEFTMPINEKLPQSERAVILVNNITESYESAVNCFKTNYYGVEDMMKEFLPLIKSSNCGKIVNVSSLGGRLAALNNGNLRRELEDIDNLSEQKIDNLAVSFLESIKDNTVQENKWVSYFNVYCSTKVLMNSYTRIFARDHPSITVNCVHPGHIKTDLNFNTGTLTASDGAEGPVMVALAEGGPTGQFYDRTQISTF